MPAHTTKSTANPVPKRCDHLPLADANPGKVEALLEVIAFFRAASPDVAADQWRRFFETGRFSKMVPAAEEARSARLTRSKAIIGSQRMQMLRYQLVGQLEGFLENRANEFRAIVLQSTLDDGVRHQLLVVNRLHAWFLRDAVTMKSGPAKEQIIADDVRRLARSIMRHVLGRHRRPRFHRLNPWIDQRQACLGKAAIAAHGDLWLGITSMRPALDRHGRPKQTQAKVQVPLASYGHHNTRLAMGGVRARTVQLVERAASRHTVKAGRATHHLADGRPGELVVGLVTDMGEAFEANRAAYRPACEEIALDFGLITMFATGEGDLLGRAWFEGLKKHDVRIDGLARRLQRQGIKPSRSKRYRQRTAALRGYVRTEVGRVLNRLVAVRRPAHIVVERLDFRTPGLSRRLNCILTCSGRAAIREKLRDIEERFGVTFAEVNPAYSSQTCSACGFVSKTNRRSQSKFECRSCGHAIHADVNAARNLEGGRSAFDRSARLTKRDSLRLTVHRHLERDKTRGRVTSAAVRRSPYYRELLAAAETPLARVMPP